MSRGKKTDLELLQILKEEIERLGLEDSPSRTQLQKVYDRDRMPHPNTYVNKFGTWQEALRLIGIEYDGKKASGKASSRANSGKTHASTWSNISKEEIVNAMVLEIHEKNIIDAKDYQERRDKEKTPSLATTTRVTGLKWGDITKVYRERFGKINTESSAGMLKEKWSNMSDEELVKVVTQEMKRIGSDRYIDYAEKRNKLETPSLTTMINRGYSWSQLKNMKKIIRRAL